MNGQVITSLAILKVNWDRKKRHIDNFVPFVAECLRLTPQKEVSLVQVQEMISNNFGITVPQGALKTVLKATERQGYVKKSADIYIKNETVIGNITLSRDRDDLLRKYESLIKKLLAFASEKHKVNWTQEEADNALLGFVQMHAVPILAACVEGMPIQTPSTTTETDYIVASFITDLEHGDPEGFKYLESVVKGSMLAGVLFYHDIGRVEQKFRNVEVYFDTNFLLRALGLSGLSIQGAYTELLNLLYELGADLRCFRHSFDEMRRILEAAEIAVRDAHSSSVRSGENIEYLIRAGYKPSDVQILLNRLERELSDLHIQVKTKPPFNPKYSIDEAGLIASLRKDVGYLREESLRNDVDSLLSIVMLRKGNQSSFIESCTAIFVTTNHSLVKASRQFFNEKIDVPACVPDDLFTTVVWLKRPLAAPNMPQKRILADCYAALNPPDPLWRQYVTEIYKLRQAGGLPETDFEILRYSSEAKAMLMEVTDGEPSAFVEGTLEEVLEKAKASIRAGTEKELQTEVIRRQTLEQELLATQRIIQRRDKKIRTLSQVGGRWITRLIMFASVILLCMGIYGTLPTSFPALPSQMDALIVPGILFFCLLSVLSLWSGFTLKSVSRKIELLISDFIEKVIRSLIEPIHAESAH